MRSQHMFIESARKRKENGVTDYFCPNCLREVDLNVHLRCAICDSDFVVQKDRPTRPELDRESLRQIAERFYVRGR